MTVPPTISHVGSVRPERSYQRTSHGLCKKSPIVNRQTRKPCASLNAAIGGHKPVYNAE